MAMRMKVIDLSIVPANVPTPITINCAYWMLRITSGANTSRMDGTPLELFATADASAAAVHGFVALDFPPVFDANGRPVMWNQKLIFTTTAGIQGTLTQVYWDPDKRQDRDR